MPSAVVLVLGMLLLQSCMLCCARISSNITDQSALLAFKSEIKFEDSNNVLLHNWSTATSCCNWIGVSCSKRRERVVALQLPRRGLQGTISAHIGNLSFLVILNLYDNSFYGHLTHELGRLRRLKKLILEKNQLEGDIPPSLCLCRTLELLDLSENKFTGMPQEFGILPNLKTLHLDVNNLSGSIPPSLGNISSLREIWLSHNNLSGSIPSTIYNITSLQGIYFDNNVLSGSLSVDICRKSLELQNLILEHNQLSGHIPLTIYKCRKLRQLDVYQNVLDGSIPMEIGRLPMLQLLYLGQNNISGRIPPSLGNNSRLENLYVGTSNIHGKIPEELGLLSKLVELNFGVNSLTGTIPHSIFNISSLLVLDFGFNALSGSLPSTAGLRLPNLNGLNLQQNQLDGNIPLYLSNALRLRILDLYGNLFAGPVPETLGNLQQLKVLHLGYNQLTGAQGYSELSFLSALINSSSLEQLTLEENPLNGFMPSSIANHSGMLQLFAAEGCQIQGHIPTWIGSLKSLNFLDLKINRLSGTIPTTIEGMKSLQRLHLSINKIEGRIPNELCNLTNLAELYLSGNMLSGSIPTCITNLGNLQVLNLSSNRLTSSIPSSLWTLENLIALDMSSNFLSSYLPASAKLDVIEYLDLSFNQISGNIPSTIAGFQRLSYLNLSKNLLQGSIPQSFGSLVALEYIDLSYNNLSGGIPKSLESLKYLKRLNLSFNKLSGEIPNGGPFTNFTALSFLGNNALCGKASLQVSPCGQENSSDSKDILLKFVLPCISLLLILGSVIFMLRRKTRAQVPNLVPFLQEVEHRMISYNDLRCATDNFSEANLLGVGSIASVYKGILSDGMAVAIKVFNLQLEDAIRNFDAECMVLRTVRHRNLVKVISSCSNPDFRALVLQYMPHGSLEKWLYSHNYCLNLKQRVSILADISLALEYLHHGQTEPVVHCDLKPSNVLLDEEMIAHVGDFGISRILAKSKLMTQTKTLGTVGYIAPEYGSEGIVSTKGDIYSLGVVLLETMTRKKPTEEMFNENLSLRQWVLASFPDNIEQVVDCNLLKMEGGNVEAIRDALSSIMELGLDCSRELVEERCDIKVVTKKISKIKLHLHRRRV